MQNKKWRVLIVDDEFRIGRLIKKLIHWDEFALECVDVVDNGGTAFEIIQSDRCPDVVITDIRMPKINGLELIAMTREIHKNMKFVVISGYKEFEYAHQALQYGVEDYLLKPVNEEELNRVLKKISDELTVQWRLEREHQILKETISQSRHIIKRDFLKNIIETEEPEEVDDRVEFQGEIYRGMDIKLDYIDYNKKDKKQDKLTITRVEEIVERILKVDTEEVLLCEKENLHIYCLFNYDFSKKKNIKNSINDILIEIEDYLMGFEQYEVSIGIGMERKEFAEIRFSIKEAHRAVGNRIKQGVGRVIYAETIHPSTGEEYLTEEEKDWIRGSIESYCVDKLDQCINQMYSRYIIQDDQDCSVCYDMAEELVNYFFSQVQEQEENERERKETLSNCQHCYTISALKKVLKNNLGKFVEESKEAAEAESVKPMGFTSVMYDASAKPFEDNVAETRNVVEYAHERGASVEAELGHILTSKAGAAEGNGKSYTREEAYTDPEMAKEFIERTNVDALAIGFGTAHGIYTEKPVLDLNRIALIKSAKDIPYVMHGGSGLSEEEYRTAIHNGIRKINYYTYLSLAGGRGVMQYLEDKKDKDAIYFEDIAKAGITAMKADVKRAMKIFESDGKI